jgi:hypothetical protein
MYCFDPVLAETRRCVLEKAGFTVTSNAVLREMEEHLQDRSYKLLIVCHTASADDRQSLIAWAEKMKLPVLSIEQMIFPSELVSKVKGVTTPNVKNRTLTGTSTSQTSPIESEHHGPGSISASA